MLNIIRHYNSNTERCLIISLFVYFARSLRYFIRNNIYGRFLNFTFPNSPKFYLNLVLQRTGHFTDITGKEGHFALAEWMKTGATEHIIKLLEDKKILREYLTICSKAANKEALGILELLHHKQISLANANVLSIGCGNGLIELLLFHIAKDKKQQISELTLIDAEDSSSIKGFGYGDEAASYASLSDTVHFLKQNGVDSKMNSYNPYKESIPLKRYNLIYSILAMGFHFPINYYLAYICKNIEHNGIIIFDCRKGTNEENLHQLFKKFTLIDKKDHGKYEQITLLNNHKQ